MKSSCRRVRRVLSASLHDFAERLALKMFPELERVRQKFMALKDILM